MQEFVEVCGLFFKCNLIKNKIEKKITEPLSWLIERTFLCIANTQLNHFHTLYKLTKLQLDYK